MTSAVRKITALEAVVKTAAVEVRLLTLNGKQVTLSVFRQFQDEDLIDKETSQLLGTPWGKVNYFWGGCEPNHLHVVWQKEDELRRACVFGPERPSHWDHQREGRISQLGNEITAGSHALLMLEHFECGGDTKFTRWVLRDQPKEPFFRLSFAGLDFSIWEKTPDLNPFYSWVERKKGERGVVRQYDKVERKVGVTKYLESLRDVKERPETDEEWFGRYKEQERTLYARVEGYIIDSAKKMGYENQLPYFAEVRGLLRSKCQEWLKRGEELSQLQEHYRGLYQEIHALDQLYIAV